MISCKDGQYVASGKSKAASITWCKAHSHSLVLDRYHHDQYNGASGVMSLFVLIIIVVVCLMIMFLGAGAM